MFAIRHVSPLTWSRRMLTIYTHACMFAYLFSNVMLKSSKFERCDMKTEIRYVCMFLNLQIVNISYYEIILRFAFNLLFL